MAKKKKKKKAAASPLNFRRLFQSQTQSVTKVSVAARKRPTKEGLEVLAATLLTLIKMSLGHSADLREMCFE